MAQVERSKENKRTAARDKQKDASHKPPWRGFVAYELTAADKAMLKAGQVDFVTAWEGVQQLIMTGYKLSLAFDQRNDSFIASLTCNAAADPNSGLTLSGRGGTFEGAVISLWFRHDTIMSGRWEDFVERQQVMWGPNDFG